jgi:hypothetical protein
MKRGRVVVTWEPQKSLSSSNAKNSALAIRVCRDEHPSEFFECEFPIIDLQDKIALFEDYAQDGSRLPRSRELAPNRWWFWRRERLARSEVQGHADLPAIRHTAVRNLTPSWQTSTFAGS